MFQVFDNGKPADCDHCAVSKSWACSKFDTFEQALEYANSWLGYGLASGVVLKLNEEWDYSGAGDTICIKAVQ